MCRGSEMSVVRTQRAHKKTRSWEIAKCLAIFCSRRPQIKVKTLESLISLESCNNRPKHSSVAAIKRDKHAKNETATWSPSIPSTKIPSGQGGNYLPCQTLVPSPGFTLPYREHYQNQVLEYEHARNNQEPTKLQFSS